MRIYLTSVEETNKIDEIQKKIKSIFPEYSVSVVPNKYASKEGKKEIKEYSKMYYEKNKERILAAKKERYYKAKTSKGIDISPQYYETDNNSKSEVKSKNMKKRQYER